MQDEVNNLRKYNAPEELRKMSERYRASGLRGAQWNDFLLNYVGDVDTTLSKHLATMRNNTNSWKGALPAQPDNQNTPLIRADADLERMPLGLLEAEIARLERIINVDRETSRRYSALSQRINAEKASLERLKERLTECEGAKLRLREFVAERETSYVRVFEAIVGEEKVLHERYDPLMQRLAVAGGTLNKLTFTVSRNVNIAAWAAAGKSTRSSKDRLFPWKRNAATACRSSA